VISSKKKKEREGKKDIRINNRVRGLEEKPRLRDPLVGGGFRKMLDSTQYLEKSSAEEMMKTQVLNLESRGKDALYSPENRRNLEDVK